MQNQPPAPKRPKPVSFTPRSSVPNPVPHSLTLPKKRPSMIFKKVRKVKEKSPPFDNGYNGGQFEEREHTTNTWEEDNIEQDFNDVCMYVHHIHVCMYMYVCTIYMYVCKNVYMYIVYMYVHIYMYMYVCTYINVHVHIYMYMYIYVYHIPGTCMFAYIIISNE